MPLPHSSNSTPNSKLLANTLLHFCSATRLKHRRAGYSGLGSAARSWSGTTPNAGDIRRAQVVPSVKCQRFRSLRRLYLPPPRPDGGAAPGSLGGLSPVVRTNIVNIVLFPMFQETSSGSTVVNNSVTNVSVCSVNGNRVRAPAYPVLVLSEVALQEPCTIVAVVLYLRRLSMTHFAQLDGMNENIVKTDPLIQICDSSHAFLWRVKLEVSDSPGLASSRPPLWSAPAHLARSQSTINPTPDVSAEPLPSYPPSANFPEMPVALLPVSEPDGDHLRWLSSLLGHCGQSSWRRTRHSYVDGPQSHLRYLKTVTFITSKPRDLYSGITVPYLDFLENLHRIFKGRMPDSRSCLITMAIVVIKKCVYGDGCDAIKSQDERRASGESRLPYEKILRNGDGGTHSDEQKPPLWITPDRFSRGNDGNSANGCSRTL
ncbi:hypothetical protein H4582DRAFT_2063244 [Lactarius indigo]|nr:hypothetical protein H4582DRAFT_2063244 [Lactarius indigo]